MSTFQAKIDSLARKIVFVTEIFQHGLILCPIALKWAVWQNTNLISANFCPIALKRIEGRVKQLEFPYYLFQNERMEIGGDVFFLA